MPIPLSDTIAIQKMRQKFGQKPDGNLGDQDSTIQYLIRESENAEDDSSENSA